MRYRFLPWALAVGISVALAAVVIPSGFLFSDQPVRALSSHSWSRYDELLYYLTGVVVLAAVLGLFGSWVLSATANQFRLNRALRFSAHVLSLGGFSPIQPALIVPVMMLLVWHLDWLEPNQWLSRVIGIIFLGTPLAAELSLRFSEYPANSWIGHLRSAGGTLQEQASALASRLIWVAMGSVLLILVVDRRSLDPPEIDMLPQLPAELILISALAVLIAFLLWLAGGLLLSGQVDSEAGYGHETEDLDQSNTSSIRTPFAWGLVTLVLLWPVLVTWFSGDPRPLGLPAGQSPGSAMLPWTTDWGSTRQGQDLHAILYHAWRGATEAGIIAAVIAAAIGMAWRFGSVYLPGTVRGVTEESLFGVPPILLFLAVTGLVIAHWRPAMDQTTIGVAVALVLMPQALRLMRLPARAIPASIACLALLGTLLAIGWTSVGLQFLGLMSMAEPTFDTVLSGVLTSQENETRWVLHRGLALMMAAVVANLIALGALVWAYNLPREFTRLRG